MLRRFYSIAASTSTTSARNASQLNNKLFLNNKTKLVDSKINFNIQTVSQNFKDINDDRKSIEIALDAKEPINTWTKEQIKEIYDTPLHDLIFASQIQHRRFHKPSEIQFCTLLSIKTGGCTEDCKYCAQSSKNPTGLKAEKMIDIETVKEKARMAKDRGSTRFCMGAAWRDMTGRKSGLRKIGEMVKYINEDLKMETCVTLGMIGKEQLSHLKESGLTAYNHNVDTSREHYPKIITTRKYDERLETIKNVQDTGIKVCSGGILGLGETEQDHVSFLYTLATLDHHPESLPINRLVAIKGTPIEKELAENVDENGKMKKLKFESIIKTIATARLIMPKSIIRLAAGRYTMKESEQLLAFMTGCNAIFTGEKMLTTMCNGWDEDTEMLAKWGFKPMESFTGSLLNSESEAQPETAAAAKSAASPEVARQDAQVEQHPLAASG